VLFWHLYLPPIFLTFWNFFISQADYGKIDILIHSLANGPEVTKPLLETSRAGYLAASSASAYSFVSLVRVRTCSLLFLFFCQQEVLQVLFFLLESFVVLLFFLD